MQPWGACPFLPDLYPTPPPPPAGLLTSLPTRPRAPPCLDRSSPSISRFVSLPHTALYSDITFSVRSSPQPCLNPPPTVTLTHTVTGTHTASPSLLDFSLYHVSPSTSLDISLAPVCLLECRLYASRESYLSPLLVDPAPRLLSGTQGGLST